MRARHLSVLLAAVALTGCTHIVHGTAIARFSLPVAGFPDKGPGSWTVDAERFGVTNTQMSVMPRGATHPTGHPNKLLPPRHYVVDSVDTLCLVTQDSVVACHVGGHGFILTPDKTPMF